MPADLPKGLQGLFELAGAEGVVIRGLVIDAADRLDCGIAVTSASAGVTIDSVRVIGARNAGVQIHQAYGTSEKPIVLDHLRIDHIDGGSRIGVLFDTEPRGINSHIKLMNSRLTGGWAAIKIQGAAQQIEISNNRISRSEIGVLCLGVDPATRLRLLNNTFHAHADCAMKLADTAADPASEVVVEQNYFARTFVLVKAHQEKWAGLKAKDNGRDKYDKNQQNGKPDIKPMEVNNAFLPDNADDDATFLRPNADSLLNTVGPSRVKVGAR